MIVNRKQLLSHGFVEGREKALEIAEYALAEVDPGVATERLVRLEDNLLRVGDDVFDLKNYRNIYIVGAGKATFPIASALDRILGDRITDGIIAVKDGQKAPLSRIRVMEAAHPVPDERSFAACEEVFKIADKAKKEDMVFCLITGGSSALCPYPVSGVSFKDKMVMNDLLVHSGADIIEICTVRKHLSQIKGGRLAERILPATIICLTVSDVIGDSLELMTDWVGPDPSTLEESVAALKKHDLWDQAPDSIRDYFTLLTQEKETPKAFPKGSPMYSYMLVESRRLCESAMKRAHELGLRPLLLTTSLNGESRYTGQVLASIAREASISGSPISPPCALIAGGETVVTVKKHTSGKGGPNQELLLGACLHLSTDDRIALCALDSDGFDGSTDFAGGVVDGSTTSRAASKGIDVYEELQNHNASYVLNAIGDFICTGSTGTNVNDLVICVVL